MDVQDEQNNHDREERNERRHELERQRRPRETAEHILSLSRHKMIYMEPTCQHPKTTMTYAHAYFLSLYLCLLIARAPQMLCILLVILSVKTFGPGQGGPTLCGF